MGKSDKPRKGVCFYRTRRKQDDFLLDRAEWMANEIKTRVRAVLPYPPHTSNKEKK